MAIKIQTKRSTGTSAPGTLGAGELAVTYGGGTQGNLGERLFIGNNAGDSVLVIGGAYFSNKLDHVDGVLTASSAITVDSSSVIDVLNVDNLTLNGNTLSTTDTNGNLLLSPHGSGTVDVGTSRITSVTDPSGAQDAATKAYVDATASGLDIKDSVVVATTADVSTWTYANGTAGVGATLTASGNGVVSIDGIALALNNRILVKDQDPATENGIYYVSTAGAVGATLVLTRSTDADTASELSSGSFAFIEKGTVNSDSGFVMTQDTAITFGSTTVTWSQFSGAGQITAGDGLDKSANTLSVDLKANGGVVIESTEMAVDLGASSITGTLVVGDGGTGATTLTDGGILLGSGTSAITALAVLSNSEMIVGNGSTDPAIESGGTLRTSIGVGTGDSPQFTSPYASTSIELGHATDTTITRSSGGVLAVEGNVIYAAGGTDVVVADGGTGASTLTDGGILLGSGTSAITALAVLSDSEMIVGDGSTDPAIESGDTLRISIGVGSSSTWRITGLNIGHDDDTTLTRVSAGDLQIESNIIYRAGGTDVAIADGGTGASTAAAAATALGVGTGDSPQLTGIELGHATDTTITRPSGGDISIEGNIVYRAGGTDVAVTDGGTGLSSLAKGTILYGSAANTIAGLDGSTASAVANASQNGILMYTTSTDLPVWSTTVDGGTF